MNMRNERDRFQAKPLHIAIVEKVGPRECCADFARIVHSDGITRTWECPFCGMTWTAPCR